MRRKRAVLFLTCVLLCGCGSTKADPAEEDPVAFTVNGEEIGLREWNFYVRMNQMQWEKEMLDAYGDGMWSHEVDEDGTTLAEDLKEQVLDTVCRIHLADQHAEEYGVALDEAKQQEIKERAASFMDDYHEKLLQYAGADETFVYELLSERELSLLTAEASVADYEPEISEDETHREGICYVLISTTGLWDEEGNLEPYTEEEVERRARVAEELCKAARESQSLKAAAEEIGLTPIESSVGISNEGDGQEPQMLDAARLLEVGEISDPVRTEEGWFLVQHTSDYDEEGTKYWREYLTDQAREEEYERLCEAWRAEADIRLNQEVMDQVDVEIVLKELL
ncbi:MAG: hypothetical protein HFI16_09395 [Lachnospiraceae bacterium]|nr:hypothetical protein [Lachnospiraceae bacterium]